MGMSGMYCKGTPKAQTENKNTLSMYSQTGAESGSWLLTDVYLAFPGNTRKWDLHTLSGHHLRIMRQREKKKKKEKKKEKQSRNDFM